MPVQIGLQLYTLREECARNLVETLSKVAELGYRGVEFAGFYGCSAVEVSRMLQEFNLHPIASHVSIDDLRQRLPEVLEFHREIGCDYIVCPWVGPQLFRDGNRARALIGELEEIGKTVGQRGMRFGYHNHAFELENRLDGEIALDALYRRTEASAVLAELDLYWIRRAGEDELAYLRRYAGRIPVVHLKDMAEDGFFAEVGTGVMDLDGIFAVGNTSGVQWYVVEQDECRHHSSLESVKISMEQLKERGWV
ncbi:MAG: sugar phosphate isomerase/epimerase [Firmicutes bacterium]|uniref:sugar phosphate isomerase/epimerase family protein n=1 Tax=Melghirimyces thermohalophilus TaxID=1236220 RepID=UPI0015A341A6|nr:sugar phosphate isomerase/epimerase [Melghirimyces thermohalophilus]MDA8351589.1 sugar phosphate isomerase/epimerase [Bacillota bacterium]